MPFARTMGPMSAPPPSAATPVAPIGERSARDRLHDRARPVRAGEAEALGLEHARVGLERGHVRLALVTVAIGGPALQAVLLVREEDDAHGAPRAQAQRLQEAHRLPRDDTAAGVVHRPGAHVPRVDVAADDHDLLGQLAALPLGDHVRGRRVRKLPCLHLQADHDALAAIGDALQALRVLERDGGRRDARDAVLVVHLSRVRRAQPGQSDRAQQDRRPRPASPRATRPRRGSGRSAGSR